VHAELYQRALEALEEKYNITRREDVAVPQLTSYAVRWVVIGICALAATVWLRALGVGLDVRAPILWVAVPMLLVSLVIGRFARSEKIRDFSLSFAQLIAALLALIPVTYLMATTNFPLIDELLAKSDAIVMFNWDSVAEWVADRPILDSLSWLIYHSIGVQLIVALWIGSRKLDRNDELLWLFIGSLLLTSVISAFTPAEGKIGHLGPAYRDLLLKIRSGEWVMHYGLTNGIITFPSFHTTLAVIVIYAVRHSGRIVLGTFVLLNLLMLLSIPTVGGHYLADMIGGAIVAGVSIAAFVVVDRLREGWSAGAPSNPAPIGKRHRPGVVSQT